MTPPRPKPDCHHSRLGLNQYQLASLTGFSSRVVAALAHLREAWCIADEENRCAIEAALRVLFTQSHSLCEYPRTVQAVLSHGLDTGLAAELTEAAGVGEQPTLAKGPDG